MKRAASQSTLSSIAALFAPALIVFVGASSQQTLSVGSGLALGLLGALAGALYVFALGANAARRTLPASVLAVALAVGVSAGVVAPLAHGAKAMLLFGGVLIVGFAGASLVFMALVTRAPTLRDAGG